MYIALHQNQSNKHNSINPFAFSYTFSHFYPEKIIFEKWEKQPDPQTRATRESAKVNPPQQGERCYRDCFEDRGFEQPGAGGIMEESGEFSVKDRYQLSLHPGSESPQEVEENLARKAGQNIPIQRQVAHHSSLQLRNALKTKTSRTGGISH